MSADPDQVVTVDFKRRETEAGWARILDRFALSITPTWFDWIQWVLALGALLYFFRQVGGVGLGIAVAISYALLLIYFQAIFARIDFQGFPGVRSVKVTRWLSFIIALTLSIGSLLIATRGADTIALLWNNSRGRTPLVSMSARPATFFSWQLIDAVTEFRAFRSPFLVVRSQGVYENQSGVS